MNFDISWQSFEVSSNQASEGYLFVEVGFCVESINFLDHLNSFVSFFNILLRYIELEQQSRNNLEKVKDHKIWIMSCIIVSYCAFTKNKVLVFFNILYFYLMGSQYLHGYANCFETIRREKVKNISTFKTLWARRLDECSSQVNRKLWDGRSVFLIWSSKTTSFSMRCLKKHLFLMFACNFLKFKPIRLLCSICL